MPCLSFWPELKAVESEAQGYCYFQKEGKGVLGC